MPLSVRLFLFSLLSPILWFSFFHSPFYFFKSQRPERNNYLWRVFGYFVLNFLQVLLIHFKATLPTALFFVTKSNAFQRVCLSLNILFLSQSSKTSFLTLPSNPRSILIFFFVFFYFFFYIGRFFSFFKH